MRVEINSVSTLLSGLMVGPGPTVRLPSWCTLAEPGSTGPNSLGNSRTEVESPTVMPSECETSMTPVISFRPAAIFCL